MSMPKPWRAPRAVSSFIWAPPGRGELSRIAEIGDLARAEIDLPQVLTAAAEIGHVEPRDTLDRLDRLVHLAHVEGVAETHALEGVERPQRVEHPLLDHALCEVRLHREIQVD